MNTFFQTLTLFFMIIVILWLIAGAEVFTVIKDKCKNLTMKDCLDNKSCKYITSSQDFRMNGCMSVNEEKNIDGMRTYKDDDYTRALIANDNLYRDTNRSVF